MAQDTTPAIIIYRGNGDNSVPYDVPFDKGYYGEVKVAFIRRGLDDYTYEPTTYVVNGRLYAWANGSNKVYTHTPNPAVGAETYNNFDEDTGDTVEAIAGQTITVDNTVYSRAVQHDIANQLLLTWTGEVLTSDDFICIVRDTERGQPYTFPNNQKHIENALDNLERQIQENKNKLDNALLVDPAHTIDTSKMAPLDWLKSIIRCVDFSVRALRYANGWLDYSLDDPNIADENKTWTHVLNTDNIKRIYDVVAIDPDTNEEVHTLYYEDSTGNSHKILLSVSMKDLTDVSITNLSIGQFLMFDGLKWKNVASSTTTTWGLILGDITNQTDLMNTFVQKSGDTMTGVLKMRASESFKCAIAPSWDGVGFFKLNDNDSVTLMASMEETDGLTPATNNKYNIGKSAYKWKNLYLSGTAYVATINNGYNIAVPATSGADTFALVNANINPLQQQINHLQTIGRFLSFWDATTGLAQTNPQTSPYVYQTGDYFRVGVVASGGGTNYKPTGSSYTTGVASTVVETEILTVGQVYYYDGTNWALAAGGSVAIDETTIVFNNDNEIQAVATVNQNTAAGATNPVFDWVGTLVEYQTQNIETLHPDWLCYIIDDVGGGDSVYTKTQIDNMFSNMLNAIWPVGSTYIGTQNTCPMAALIPNSTWTLVAQDRALWGGNGSNANTTIAAGLPNIAGVVTGLGDVTVSGAFERGPRVAGNGGGGGTINADTFDASRSSSIYGSSTTVQPPAYRVNVWRRTA